jgi:phytoene dehydrogenase-like protein
MRLKRSWSRKNISRYICAPILHFEKEYIPEDIQFVSQFHNRSYHDHITSLVSNRHLQTALFAQWPYAGISPEKCGALYSFTMLLLHKREGSHFCKGGFSSLANALSSVITSKGGMVLTKKTVSGLVVENGRVSHVETSDGLTTVLHMLYQISNQISNTSLLPKKQGEKMVEED